MLITSNKDVFKPALSKRIAMKATLVSYIQNLKLSSSTIAKVKRNMEYY